MSTFSKIGQKHLMAHKILSGLQLTFLGDIIENIKKKLNGMKWKIVTD